MKQGLPSNANIPTEVTADPRLLPVDDTGQAALTDIQYEALQRGVARGTSMLVCAPTSTGKTNIGWWTISSALSESRRAVYLVSHRALAYQKFEEARHLFLSNYLYDDPSALVCATGDTVEDASNRKTNAPLTASLLIATYEKFLGCLSASMVSHDFRDVTFVCDELQIVGDQSRGRNVELLLTLIKRSGWKQFVGLSAVLDGRDAQSISDWLDIELLRSTFREKALRIECRGENTTLISRIAPGRDGDISQNRSMSTVPSTASLVNELLRDRRQSPVIVFCMRVDDTYDLPKVYLTSPAKQQITPPSGVEVSDDLRSLLERKIAFHNAELSIDERIFVESLLQEGKIDVVFATSTLAAGVNFPLGSAVFASWKRYVFEKGQHEPIAKADFQNMAGRVGRMGQVSEEGRVVITARGGLELSQAKKIIDFTTLDTIGDGIDPDELGTLSLQIFSAKLCNNRVDAFALLSSTLSASNEIQRNAAGVDHWKPKLNAQIDLLLQSGCLIERQGRLSVTAFGAAIARSGLRPDTAIFFLSELVARSTYLCSLLLPIDGHSLEDDFLFILVHAALCSPEFDENLPKAPRKINYRFKQRSRLLTNPVASRLAQSLFINPWASEVAAANACLVLGRWAGGEARQAVESTIPSVRAGLIQALASEVASVLTGISEVLAATTALSLADESKPEILRGESSELSDLRKLIRPIARQALRVSQGLPAEVLWMANMELAGPRKRLTRSQILSLKNSGLVRPIDVMSGASSHEGLRRAALGAITDPSLSNQVRAAAKRWKVEDRAHSARHHGVRAKRLGREIEIRSLYERRENAFESAFEACLHLVNVTFDRLDTPARQGWPDYLIIIEDFPAVVFELKTRLSDEDLVSLSLANEVLSASELASLRDNHCITLCNPGVEPSVPGSIENVGRLTVVDTCDFAEAILRLLEGTLTHRGFYDWLCIPGIALAETIPHN